MSFTPDVDTLILGIVALGIMLMQAFSVKELRKIIESQAAQLKQLTLAAMAFEASGSKNPMVGPAVIQQLGKMEGQAASQKPTKEPTPDPQRTGVRLTQRI
jgi:hypothetical protein